ncbi:MAG: hypothetical protein H6658_03590 [Ardenticatenaceae bacterium]|nr:hypothetical protein [Ardenticatenaceae bacterium]
MTKQNYNFIMSQRLNRHQILTRQIARLDEKLTRLSQRSTRLSNVRLAVFIGGIALSGLVLLSWGAWQWAVVFVLSLALFVVVVVQHQRVTGLAHQLTLWRQLKVEQVARMDLDWQAMPSALPVPFGLEHPFALDLDLIGERSLQRLLDTAVSHEGKTRLRDWLLSTELDPAIIAQRRQRVMALQQMPHFRDKLRLKGLLVSEKEWYGQPLLDWLFAGRQDEGLRRVLWVLGATAVLNLTLAAFYLVGRISPLWAVFSWFVYGLITISQWPKTGPLFTEASFLADGLHRLEPVFHFLEHYPYGEREYVRQLCAPFWEVEKRPSQQLAQIKRVVAGAGLRYNPGIGFGLNFLMPWDVYFAYRLEQCKQGLQTILPLWLDTWAELESLNALANFAWLNPEAVYPQFTEQPSFAAQQLGHPLIPRHERVCNDFALTQLGTLGLVTGSNMAGKSSFLRTVGINLRLAYVGGPVVAQSLQTSLFRLYTSIQIHDSLADGFSFFYAEVRRLQALLAALQEREKRPLCFLIDEIFRGTNNRERLIGSRAYIRALVNGHGLGLVATHDLELVQLAEELPGIQNYHFRDAVENGRMIFDYKLHNGPCPTTNALKIMQLAGLPIEV